MVKTFLRVQTPFDLGNIKKGSFRLTRLKTIQNAIECLCNARKR